MTSISGQLDNPFWNFSIEVYGRPGVSDAFLLLQEKLQADVNILLFALYNARFGAEPVTPNCVEEWDKAIGAWRRDVVIPLRSARRALKDFSEFSDPTSLKDMRARVGKAELFAEQVEQERLFSLFPVSGGQADRSQPSKRRLVLALEAAARYYSADALEADEVRSAMNHVAAKADDNKPS